MRLALFLISLIWLLSQADLTVWSYSLTELPQGWVSTGEWLFDSTGAHIDIEVRGADQGRHCIFTESLIIPEETDSLTIFVPQYSYGQATFAHAYAVLEITVNENQPETLWHRTWYNETTVYTQPIIEGVAVQPQDSISFCFGCDVIPTLSSDYVRLKWQMCDLELVLHGELQDLEPYSWGAVKASFR